MDAAAHLYARGGDPLIIAAPSVAPYTTSALTANLVFRVMLGIVADLVCIVPLRLLYRNGELAAFVFIINIMVKNIQTVVNALIWRDDHVESWWPGYGLCDISAFFHNFSIGLFATCLLAITRNLATQVGLMRANPLTVKEKRKRNLVQALIMFPLPLIQLGLTWFLTAQRYAIGTLIGCSWVGYGAWPYLVFFVLAPVVVSLFTVGYAVLTYLRFREVAKTTKSALSSNHTVSSRAQRTRRRLYLMIVTIIIPYFPIPLALCVLNIVDMGEIKPYDYDAIHNSATPYPWNSIFYLTSDQISFILMNNAYIPILTCIPVFFYFGTTTGAMKDYRAMLVFLGLGNIFPRLFLEYDPNRTYLSNGSQGSASRYMTHTESHNPKLRSTTSSHPLSTVTSSTGDTIVDNGQQQQSLNFLTSSLQENGGQPLQHPEATQQRCYDTTIHRNPFLMRTHLAFPIPFKLPSLFKARKRDHGSSHSDMPLQPLDSGRTDWTSTAQSTIASGGIQTHVWSDDEERRLYGSNGDNRRSIASDNGVHIETHFTRETHETRPDDYDEQQRRY